MNANGIDAWISPAAPGPAPTGLQATGVPIMNLPWTHAGMPAVSLPGGSVDGLPIGLQVAARFGDDERLLRWATALEVELR
jgi:Asp-tRNA(Asn)/Glu-tRNA(Gln) amidotransferase A subunit family amidase